VEQLDLIRPEDLPSSAAQLEAAAAMGEYTGELLRRRKPELYSAAVALLGHGMGVRRTAKITGLSPRSVMGVADREGSTIATLKESTAKDLLRLGQLGAEACLESLLNNEEINKSERRDLMVAVGIAIDKGLLLAGEATWRGEMVQRKAPEHDDFNKFIDIDGESEWIGSREETPHQKAPAEDDGNCVPVAQLDRAPDYGSRAISLHSHANTHFPSTDVCNGVNAADAAGRTERYATPPPPSPDAPEIPPNNPPDVPRPDAAGPAPGHGDAGVRDAGPDAAQPGGRSGPDAAPD
jgi:hypothetical protein